MSRVELETTRYTKMRVHIFRARASPISSKRFYGHLTAAKIAESPSEKNHRRRCVHENTPENSVVFIFRSIVSRQTFDKLLRTTPKIRPVWPLNVQRIRTGTSEVSGIFSVRFPVRLWTSWNRWLFHRKPRFHDHPFVRRTSSVSFVGNDCLKWIKYKQPNFKNI